MNTRTTIPGSFIHYRDAASRVRIDLGLLTKHRGRILQEAARFALRASTIAQRGRRQRRGDCDAGARHPLTTLVFSLANGLVLRLLSYPQTDRIVVLDEYRPTNGNESGNG